MTPPDTFRQKAITRFEAARKHLLALVKANKVLSNDNLENGDAYVAEMSKLVRPLEQSAKKKTMSEQFKKFEDEWKKAKAGKGNGKIEHYLVKMATTPMGGAPVAAKTAPSGPKPPARPSSPAPTNRP
jgi:hypothetical protein